MTIANLVKGIGTAASVILAGISVQYPQYAAFLVPLSTLLVGWLHLPQPGTAKAP